MLEKPNIEDDRIIECLASAYGLKIGRLVFLPLGADLNTAVYRATTTEQANYFLKLRRDNFHPSSVTVPHHLSKVGMAQVIAPIATQSGTLWTTVEPYRLILFPFVVGRDGFERPLTNHQRIEFGTALKKFHTTVFPEGVIEGVKQGTFSPRWPSVVRHYLTVVEQQSFTDPVAVELAHFLQTKRQATEQLVARSEQLAAQLKAQPLPSILCHGDMHGWNMLVGENGRFYIVDWDTLIFAPKERDLMFIGCSLGGRGHTLAQETALFYEGYGATDLNETVLAYYRYERIVEDIALYCQQIFLSNEGGEDRRQALTYLRSNYEPNRTIALAQRLDRA